MCTCVTSASEPWWQQDMKTLFALLALWERNLPVTDIRIPRTKRQLCGALMFLWCYNWGAVEKTVVRWVIWDVLTSTWRHCNDSQINQNWVRNGIRLSHVRYLKFSYFIPVGTVGDIWGRYRYSNMSIFQVVVLTTGICRTSAYNSAWFALMSKPIYILYARYKLPPVYSRTHTHTNTRHYGGSGSGTRRDPALVACQHRRRLGNIDGCPTADTAPECTLLPTTLRWSFPS